MSKRPKEDLSATDPDKKKPEVLAKSKHFKLFNLSDVLKPTKHLDHSIEQHPKRAGLTKSMTQTTLEYFFRHSAGKNQVYANTNHVPKKKILHKQNSIGSYPIRIEVTDEDDRTKSQEKLEVPRDSDALALERPRKKLSFKIPEISTAKQGSKNKSGSYGCISKLVVSPQSLPGLPRNSSFNGILHKGPSCEDWDLESQAMRVVRTIGQAFEVCHKLSINAPPENENLEQDEQETLTQDLLSDRLSDINSDKPKRDLISEGASDRMSLPPDDCGSFRDLEATSCFVGGGKGGAVRPSPHIDVLPPPPNHNPKKSSLTSAETYAAPHSDAFPATASVSVINSSGGDSISLPIGGALSAHHELQLMREQLDQQQQQTREALSQLQLVREQLAAEQSARLEAQARTHQLLIHNRELLDHIAALVAHLQGGDKPGQQPTPPHMTMPQGEPTSPQPSIDRLSVTFAEDSVRSDSSTRINYFNPAPTIEEAMQISQNENPEQDSDQEDYSASVNAIIQRRASTKKSRRRRASSPFSPDVLPGTENGRRRSSVYTTSSGDTAITMDENLAAEATQEEIFENIKLHKEVLSNVKMQPWNMRKKLKLVVQAKAYIKKHEGALQERLAQSHSTKDILARWNILFIKKWQRWKRETLNLSMWFIPWELKIKEIESHFGSVVASYFIFLRWLFWVNIVIAVVLVSFVTIPEMLVANSTAAGDRKKILEEDRYNSTNFMTLWEFEGVFKYSPIFYGWYTNDDNYKGYRLPLAYFMTGLVVYAYSFFAILRKMAENSRMSKLSEKDDECIFSWKLFTGWDYMIGNAETAHNRVASIVMGFKEALLEEAEKKKDTRNWKIICCRMLVNTVIMGLLSFSGFVVVMLVERSRQPDANSTFWRKNETSIIISLITSGFPILFEILGFLEQYHPRKQLRLQLARIMVLNLLNLYSLIFALFVQIDKMTARLEGYKNITEAFNKSSTSTEVSYIWSRMCTLNCSVTLQNESIIYNYTDISNLIDTITTTALPKLHQIISNATMESSNTELEMTSTIFPEENFTGYSNYTMTDTSIVDLKNAFVDYLTYILNSVVSDVNETYVGNSTIFPLNENETYNISTIDEYETFKTTVLPTFLYDDSTTTSMEEELSSLYNDITTDITTFKESLTDQTTSVVEYKYEDCVKNCEDITFPNIMDKLITTFNYTSKKDLRSLCWETMYGQELIKLTVMDLIMTIVSALAIDFVRGIFVRVMNRCWCWDLERSFPQYGDFKVAENILSLVNNQGMVWMGMFFSPGLVPLNVFKLYIMMYFRSWAVLTCNVPHEVIFRASRSNNFYYALLLMMLFLCVLPVGYAIVWIKPSWHCGPFSTYHRIFHIFTKTIRNTVPFHRVLDYIASPGIVIPLLVLLILIIYYLVSLTAALREANEELKVQLRRERTEERRKMFQLADRRRRGGSGESNEFSNTPYNKWKKLLGNLPSGKSLDDTPKQETDEVPESVKIETKSKDFFSKLIKRALRKSSTSEDEHNVEDGTDTEQHDSLPDDPAPKPSRPSFTWGASDFQAIAHKTLQLARSRRSSSSSPRELEETTTKGPAEESKQMEESKPPAGVIQKEERQDSESSVWSDNIPVIKISKTESSEDILEAGTKAARPKLRATLRKQSTEIDEDALEGKFEEVLTDRSSSESTDHKGSVETILNAPIKKKEE